MVSYTWSKAIDIASSGWYGVEGSRLRIPTMRSIATAACPAFDLTHVLTINTVYDVPIGKGNILAPKTASPHYILGNWQFNKTSSSRGSGMPYNIFVSGDVANTGNAGCCNGYYMRLNLVGNPRLANPTPRGWLNRSAFAVPAPFTFGNLGRHSLRGDGTQNFDLSIFRQFPLGTGCGRSRRGRRREADEWCR